MKKTTRAGDAAPTEQPETAAPRQEDAPAKPLQMPASGGSWIRMPDGTLKKEGNA